jgi:WD40 repeat protein
LEENTDFELDKIFEINFDLRSKKNEKSDFKIFIKKNKGIKNSISLCDNYKCLDLNSNNSNNELVNNTLNNRTFTSLSANKFFFESNRIRNNNIIKNNRKTIEGFMINKIKFNDIIIDKIDIAYFNSKYKTIPINYKNINNYKSKQIKKLYELQDFIAEDSSPTVIKIDEEGEYLSIGFKNGVIKIYEILNYNYHKYKMFYNKNNIKEYLNFIEETPFKSLTAHQNEIIDLFWLFSSNNYFLSSSLNLIILWDFKSNTNNHIIKKYYYSDSILCLSINPIIQNMFATGCTDKKIRLWSINKSLLKYNNSNIINIQDNCENKEVNDFSIKNEIISISFLQEGDKIAIGTNNSKILIYSIFPKINFEYKINCKKMLGKPITNIIFFSKASCIISSLDSSIRFIKIKEKKIIHKYKGHKNEKKDIKIGVDHCNDAIISGSENGFCYLWNIFSKENNNIKNNSYEYFKPFSSNDAINVALIANEKCYVKYFQKILKITNKIIIESIIINANEKGRIKIMLNINESN